MTDQGWDAGPTGHWSWLDGWSGVRCRHDRSLVPAGWLEVKAYLVIGVCWMADQGLGAGMTSHCAGWVTGRG